MHFSNLSSLFFNLGMASVVRMARHHPEYLLTQYKPLMQHVMTHVKNLRSQVCLCIHLTTKGQLSMFVCGQLWKIYKPHDLYEISQTLGMQSCGDGNG